MAEQQQSGAALPAAPQIPARGTPEWDAYVTKRFDEQSAQANSSSVEEQAAPKAERPADVPEQFWNAEKGEVDFVKMAKSYTEAQRKITELSQQRTKAPEQQPAGPTPAEKHAADVKAHADKKVALQSALDQVKAKQGATPEEIKAAEDAIKAHGEPPAAPQVDAKVSTKQLMEEVGRTLSEGKQISDEQYAKFEKLGIDRETLDLHIEGQKALAEKRDAAVKTKAGVTDADWDAMKTWAEGALSDAEKSALNKALAGDSEAAALALQGLKAKHTAAVGTDPKLLGGNPPAAKGGFTSLSEQTAAQKDARYRTDASYRAEVERRIAASTY